MNYKNYLILFFVSVTMNIFGQQYQRPFQIYKENEKFGLKDAEQKIIVKPIYLDIKVSQFGIFAMQSDNRKWAIFDSQGVQITDFLYDKMEQNLPNVVEVRQGSLVGLISESGKLLVPVEYDKITPVGKVILTQATLINNEMKPRAFVYRGSIVTQTNKFGYITETGQKTLNLTYERVRATGIYELEKGFLDVIGLVVTNGGKSGIVSETGQIILPLIYDYINAANHLGLGELEQNGKKGLYNNRLEVVAKPQFEEISILNKGFFAGKNGVSWKVFDTQGSTEIYAVADGVYPFANGYTKVMKSGKWGVLDANASLKVPFEYDAVIPFGKNVLLTKKEENFIYNSEGKIKKWNYSMDISWQNLEDKLKPVKSKNTKWGYINDDGDWVIQPIFDIAKDFRKGIAIVCQSGLYGFINNKGKFILPMEYELPDYDYEPAVLLAKKDNRYGYLDYEGHILVALNYEEIAPYSSIMKAKKEKKWGFIREDETIILPFKYDFVEDFGVDKTTFRFQNETVIGWVDLKGKERTTEQLSTWADNVETPLGGVQNVKVGNYYGLIQENGRWIIPVRYQNKIEFDAFGKAIVRENLRWGMIDKGGNIVISTIYQEKIKFDRLNFACVRENGRYGIIDYNGKVIIPTIYESYIYSDYDYWTVKQNGLFGILDSKGNVLIPIAYEKVFPYIDGLALVKKSEKWGYINTRNEIVIPFDYEILNSFVNGRGIAKKGGYWGIIDMQNRTLLPFDYDNLVEELEGFTSVMRQGLWGVVDSKFNIIIPAQYNRIDALDNYFRVEKNEKIGLFTKDGQMILPAFYDALTLENQGFKVKKDEKVGLLTFDGDVIIPVIYDELMYFSGGFSRVKKGGYYGMVSLEGKLVVPCEYNALGLRFEGNFIEAMKNNKWGIINKNNKTVVPFQYDKIRWASGVAEGYFNGVWNIIEI